MVFDVEEGISSGRESQTRSVRNVQMIPFCEAGPVLVQLVRMHVMVGMLRSPIVSVTMDVFMHLLAYT